MIDPESAEITLKVSGKFAVTKTVTYLSTNPSMQDITFYEEDSQKQKEVTVTAKVKASAAKVNVQVSKASSTKEPLAGAVFGVYSDA